MDAMQAIMERRSIRVFGERPVSDAELQPILRAGMYAPSALDQRPWVFVIIRDRERLRAWARDMDGMEMLATAPLAVLVCGDLQREQLPGYWVQDCSACAQNIQLAAHALNLGTVWIAVDFPDRASPLREALRLPDNINPLALIPIGEPAERPEAGERYDPGRVYREVWGKTGE